MVESLLVYEAFRPEHLCCPPGEVEVGTAARASGTLLRSSLA
jgi:hypothetical protein